MELFDDMRSGGEKLWIGGTKDGPGQPMCPTSQRRRLVTWPLYVRRQWQLRSWLEASSIATEGGTGRRATLDVSRSQCFFGFDNILVPFPNHIV